jgi:hypothetical protein
MAPRKCSPRHLDHAPTPDSAQFAFRARRGPWRSNPAMKPCAATPRAKASDSIRPSCPLRHCQGAGVYTLSTTGLISGQLARGLDLRRQGGGGWWRIFRNAVVERRLRLFPCCPFPSSGRSIPPFPQSGFQLPEYGRVDGSPRPGPDLVLDQKPSFAVVFQPGLMVCATISCRCGCWQKLAVPKRIACGHSRGCETKQCTRSAWYLKPDVLARQT